MGAAWDWVRRRFELTASPDGVLRAYNEAVLRLLEQPCRAPSRRPFPHRRRCAGGACPWAWPPPRSGRGLDATLRGLGLQDAFGVVVSASEVENAKPAPDLFLAAAARLGVPPDRCLAVEDTEPGIAAAKAAGMFAVQLRAASTALPPLPEADLVLDSLTDFDLSLVDAEGQP